MTRLGREMFKAIYGYDIVEQWMKTQGEQNTQVNEGEQGVSGGQGGSRINVFAFIVISK